MSGVSAWCTPSELCKWIAASAHRVIVSEVANNPRFISAVYQKIIRQQVVGDNALFAMSQRAAKSRLGAQRCMHVQRRYDVEKSNPPVQNQMPGRHIAREGVDSIQVGLQVVEPSAYHGDKCLLIGTAEIAPAHVAAEDSAGNQQHSPPRDHVGLPANR